MKVLKEKDGKESWVDKKKIAPLKKKIAPPVESETAAEEVVAVAETAAEETPDVAESAPEEVVMEAEIATSESKVIVETLPEEINADTEILSLGNTVVEETAPGDISADAEYSKLAVVIIPLREITPDPEIQPRSPFKSEETDEAFDDLVRSIKEHGVLQPILIRKDGDRNLIVAGERRFHASVKAGKSAIPAIYVDGDPATIALIENLHRVGLTTIEEAEALAKISEAKKCDDKLLAELIGKSPSTISVLLKIAALPEDFRDKYRAEKSTSQRKLIKIARIYDIDDQRKAMEKFVKDEQQTVKIPKEEVQAKELTPEEVAAAEVKANKLAVSINKKQQEMPFQMLLKIGNDLAKRINSLRLDVLPKLNPELDKSVQEMLSKLSEALQSVAAARTGNEDTSGTGEV